MAQYRGQREHDLTALRIVRSHAAQPQAILLRAVVNRQLVLLDEFRALAGRESQRIAGALHRQKHLAAVIVFPLARVHRAAPQPDNHGQMLDTHRALELACAAGCALERRFHRDVFAQQRLFVAGPFFIQIMPQPQDNLFGVERFAGIVRRTVLGAAPALHAGISLQRVDLGDVLAGVQAEVLVAHQRRNLAESVPPQKHGGRADQQVQVLGVRDQRQKRQQRDGVQPPIRARRRGGFLHPEPRQVGDHQDENEQRDDAGFRRDFAQPDGARDEAADGQAGDGDRHKHGPHGHESEIGFAESAFAAKKRQAETGGNVVDGDQRERTEAPEDEGVREAGQRTLPDHFPLQQHFPDELPDTRR